MNTRKKATLWLIVPMTSLLAIGVLANVTCPDKAYSCHDGETCCKLKMGGYGCCPMLHAVCCSDGVHCCPQGSKCDVARKTCVFGKGSWPIFPNFPVKEKSEAKKIVDRDEATESLALSATSTDCGGDHVQCVDGVCCPAGNTCCQIGEDGSMGCCPVSQGVCCPNMERCCPPGFVCSDKPGITCEVPKGRWRYH